MGREAEVAVKLDEALEVESVAGVERGVVVAAEKAEGGEADDGVRLLGDEGVGDAGEPLLGARERDEDVCEDGGGARTAIWTVPVRKGETVTLHANGAAVGCKTQFIYFGVKE